MHKFSLLVLLLLTLVACKKKDDVSPADTISRSWKVSQVSVNGKSDNVDYSNFRLVLRSDGSYTRTNENGLVSTGRWELNGQTLLFDKGTANEQAATVSEATESSLVYEVLSQNYKSGDVRRKFQLIPA